MATESQEFIKQLADRFIAGGLDANTELPLRIQMGRDVVYKGTLGQEPEVDRLTPARLQVLQAVLERADVGSEMVAMQHSIASNELYQSLKDSTVAEIYDQHGSDLHTAFELIKGEGKFEYPDQSHKTVNEFFLDLGINLAKTPNLEVNHKGIVNIDLGSDRVFRYNKEGVVEIDVFSPVVYAAKQQEQAQELQQEPQQEEPEQVSPDPEEREDKALENASDITEEEWLRAAATNPVFSDLHEPMERFYCEHRQQPQQGVEATTEDVYSTLEATTRTIKVYESEHDLSLTEYELWENEECLAVNRDLAATLENANLTGKITLELSEYSGVSEHTLTQIQAWMKEHGVKAEIINHQVEQQAPESQIAEDQIEPSASEVAEPEVIATPIKAKQPAWASQAERQARLEEVRSNAVDTVPAAAIAVIELHDQVNPSAQQWLHHQFQEVAESSIGEELRAKGGKTARETLKHVGALSKAAKEKAICDSVVALTQEHGSVQEVKPGKHQFVYRAEKYIVRVTGTDQYSVEDKATGKELLAFQHGRLGLNVSHNEMNASQQLDCLTAGSQWAATKGAEAVQKAATQVKQIATTIKALTPESTRAKLQTLQHQQVATIADMLTQSKAAVSTAIGKVFEGDRFKFVKTLSGVTQVSSKRDGRGEILQAQNGSIQSKMTDQDLAAITEAGRALTQMQSQSPRTPAQTEAAR